MPHGKGTYGNQVGRPRKKYADGTTEEDQSLLEEGYDSLVEAINPLTPVYKPLQKIDEAVDDYPVLDSLISPIAKGVGFLSDTADSILKAPKTAVTSVLNRQEENPTTGFVRADYDEKRDQFVPVSKEEQQKDLDILREEEDSSRGLFGGIGKKGRQERRQNRRTKRKERREDRQSKRATRRKERRGARDLETYEEKLAREARKKARSDLRGRQQTAGVQRRSRLNRDAMFKREIDALVGSNAGTEGSRGTRRAVRAEGGPMDEQMAMLMESEETHVMPDGTVMPGATHQEYEEQTMLPDEEMLMLPDEEMEEDYVDYVIEETLSNQDRNYLIDALEKDDRLSEIFDQVVESATEFSGSGTVEGPGTGRSDSIPARLSDGEFVFTAKATEEIGEDALMSMMKDAEASADQRQQVAYGGYMTEREDETVPIQTSGIREARRNVPQVAQTKRQVEEEMLKSSPRRFYQPISG